MIAFTTAIEPLRLANRQSPAPVYNYRIVTTDGGAVTASNGVTVNGQVGLPQEERDLFGPDKPDYFFVCTGTEVDRLETRRLRTYLRKAHARGVTVGGLCTGSWVLAHSGILDDHRCAIHWEVLPHFEEHYPNTTVFPGLFEVDDGIYTCAGGTASLDMILHIIGEDHGEDLVGRVCEQLLTDRVRNPQDRQRQPLRARLGINNGKLLFIIELMENHISDPLGMDEIARIAGLSRRQIERLFIHHLGRTPARYYLEVRLERARHLLIQSTMPIIDVAVACGFVSASHFSRCYRELYGRSPQADRRARDVHEERVSSL